jgi:hypothetical protein
MPQTVEFWPDETQAPVTISARDASRLVEELRRDGSRDALALADKIEQASALRATPGVELKVGEDEAALRALGALRVTDDFLEALGRLERDIKAKIEREP